MHSFLEEFGTDLDFGQYLDDPDKIDSASQLVKVAGQTCYLAFDPKRSHNKDAGKYIDNLLSSGHGSVLQHASFSFLFYGISRSLTHELVRHGIGTAFSQCSQRYVDGKKLRFVERPEYTRCEDLHRQFLNRIDCVALEYEGTAEQLMKNAGYDPSQGRMPTDLRKKVNQAARSLLPNETEAPMVMSANARAWRNIIEQRGSIHAEVEIRRLAVKILLCLRSESPLLFGDYTIQDTEDGYQEVRNTWRKV